MHDGYTSLACEIYCSEGALDIAPYWIADKESREGYLHATLVHPLLKSELRSKCYVYDDSGTGINLFVEEDTGHTFNLVSKMANAHYHRAEHKEYLLGLLKQ